MWGVITVNRSHARAPELSLYNIVCILPTKRYVICVMSLSDIIVSVESALHTIADHEPDASQSISICILWRHQMKTFSALLALCEGNPPATGGFPSQRPVTRSFDVFFDLRLNKRLSIQSRRWKFETPSRSLWRHCNTISWVLICIWVC